MPIRDPFPNSAGTSAHAAGRCDADGQYRDLCSNCDHGDACVGGTRPRRPIFFCEEFEVSGAVAARELNRPVEERPRAMPSTNGYVGLCMNCENARTCVLPKPEGGIWHCEEYR